MPMGRPCSSYATRGSTLSLRSFAASATWRLNSDSSRRVVSTPTIVAKPRRITSVSSAEPPASRQRIGSRLYAEDVACAADRMKEPWLATGFQLPPQVGHEHLDRVRDRERVVAPDLVEQLLTRDHEPLVAHQVLEQLELALGQLDRALAAMHLVRVGVEREVADAQRGHAARRAPAQQGAEPGEQLLALERLDEVVVGADVEAFDARVERVARGQHQDRRVVPVLAQPARDVDPVHARKPEVEHQYVGQEGVNLVEGGDAVAGELDLVALQPQRALQHLRDLLVVLHHEDSNGTVGGVHMQEEIMAAALAAANPGGGARPGASNRLPEACRRPHAASRAPVAPRRCGRGVAAYPCSSSGTGTWSGSGSWRSRSSSPSSSISAGTGARRAAGSWTGCAGSSAPRTISSPSRCSRPGPCWCCARCSRPCARSGPAVRACSRPAASASRPGRWGSAAARRSRTTAGWRGRACTSSRRRCSAASGRTSSQSSSSSPAYCF